MAVALLLVASKLTINLGFPPLIGQIVAGVALAGIVWLFFERVEAVLNDDTKLEIAVWLLDRKRLSSTFESWPHTFSTVFDRVFGTKHLSWKCFWRSSMASFIAAMLATLLAYFGPESAIQTEFNNDLYGTSLRLILAITLGICITDYVSLLDTRWFLSLMSRRHQTLAWTGLLLADLLVTTTLATYGLAVADFLFFVLFFGWHVTEPVPLDLLGQHYSLTPMSRLVEILKIEVRRPDIAITNLWKQEFHFAFLAAFLTSIWLWLYAGSGFLLKAARRFDVGFDWFNRKFDIERKPLQSIGLVAGALVAMVYWVVVVVGHFGH
jgi:hypothetical protein